MPDASKRTETATMMQKLDASPETPSVDGLQRDTDNASVLTEARIRD